MEKKTGARKPARDLSSADKEGRHYEVLGLPPFSSAEEVEEPHSALVKELKPLADAGDKTASKKLVDVNRAEQILSDPDTKLQYDDHLRATSRTAASGQTTPEPTPQTQATADPEPGDDVVTPNIGNPHGRNIEPPFTSNALYRRGDRVRHGSFGTGQVTRTKQVRDGQVVYIEFGDQQSGNREIYNRFDGLTHL